MKKIGLLLIATLFLYGCPPRDQWADVAWGTWFRNDSKNLVTFYINFVKISNEEYRLSNKWPDSFNDEFFIDIDAGKEGKFSIKPYKYVKYTDEDSLLVFVFSPDTLAKYSIEEIKSTNNYLKRFDIKCKELGKTLAYP